MANDARDYLYDVLERGNAAFARGDSAGAIRQYENALRSFWVSGEVAELRPVYQKIWSNKAMAHQQLRQYSVAQEAAMIANALLDKMRSQPAPEDAAGRACRRCASSLATGAVEEHPSLKIVRCSRCEYRNVLSCPERKVPFVESLGNAGLDERAREILQQARISGDAGTVLILCIRALVERCIELVDAAPEEFAGGLWQMFERTEDVLRESGRERLTADTGRSAYAKAASLIYLLVARHGLPEMQATGAVSPRLGTELWPLAGDAAALGADARAVLRGEWSARIDDDSLVLAPTQRYLDLAEWRINRHHFYEREVQPQDPEREVLFDQMLELTRGYTLKELLALVELIVKNVTGYLQPGEEIRLMWPMLDRLQEGERRMLEDFALTPERLRRFSEPFYFDLGEPANRTVSDLDLGVSLALHAWTTYYPVFPILLRGNRHFLLPFRTLNLALVNLKIFKSRIFERLYESAHAAGADSDKARKQALKKAGTVRARLNRLAETRAAKALEQDGWHARAGVTVSDPENPGVQEEIDVLAARQVGERFVVLLGEVKDFDLGLHRASAERNFGARIERAAEQVSRKSAFVQRAWRGILRDILKLADEPAVKPALLGMLLTTEYMPLSLAKECALLCEDDLPKLTELLADVELSNTMLERGWKTLE